VRVVAVAPTETESRASAGELKQRRGWIGRAQLDNRLRRRLRIGSVLLLRSILLRSVLLRSVLLRSVLLRSVLLRSVLLRLGRSGQRRQHKERQGSEEQASSHRFIVSAWRA